MPNMSCVSCLKKVQRSDFSVACSSCVSIFHGSCVNITAIDIENLKKESRDWLCVSCQGERRRSMALAEAAKQGTVTLSDIINLLNDMRLENKKMEENLGKSINFCHETMTNLVGRMEEQEKLLKACREEVDGYAAEVKSLKAKNADLEDRLIEMEQYSRVNSVEIHGVPHSPTEDIEDVVISVGKALGCEFKREEIEVCHRLSKRKISEGPAPIIAKFLKRNVKDNLLQSRRVKRDFSTRHLNMPTDLPVYINESLCPGRRIVFAAARKAKVERGYKYLWIRGGKILIRKSDGSPVIMLKNLQDVSDLK